MFSFAIRIHLLPGGFISCIPSFALRFINEVMSCSNFFPFVTCMYVVVKAIRSFCMESNLCKQLVFK